MDSHASIATKLKDSTPKSVLVTNEFVYNLYSTKTTKSCILAKLCLNYGTQKLFDDISEDVYIDFLVFFKIISISKQILEFKMKTSNSKFDLDTIKKVIKVGEIEKKIYILHTINISGFMSNIELRKLQCDAANTQYQPILTISTNENKKTIVLMNNINLIIQSFYHFYFQTISASEPYSCFNIFKNGITICGVVYITSNKFIMDLIKIGNEIYSNSVNFESFVNTVEKILILAQKGRQYQLSKPAEFKFLTYLSVIGPFLEAKCLIDIICLCYASKVSQKKDEQFYHDIKQIRQDYNISMFKILTVPK